MAAVNVAGAIAGYSALTHRLVDPTLQALRAIPSIAWVPLFILWLGIYEKSKVTLIAVGRSAPLLGRSPGGPPRRSGSRRSCPGRRSPTT